MKRIISIILSTLILCSVFSGLNITTFGAGTNNTTETPREDFWVQIFRDKVYHNDVAYITKYTGNDTDVVIPRRIDNATVTFVYSYAFANCESVVNVTIPDSVHSIGDDAFKNCTNLKTVSLPDSVTEIGESAFFGCASLETMTIPNSVTEIGKSAFYNCTKLNKIQLSFSIKSINDDTFYGCQNLKTASFGDGITSIGNNAFYGCKSLETIYTPIALKTIGDSAFFACQSLKSFNSTNRAHSLESIGSLAFGECHSLEEIKFPNSLINLGTGAFTNCKSLTEINLSNTKINILNNSTFYGCENLKTAKMLAPLKSIDNYAFYGCKSLVNIETYDSIDRIGNYAFSGCISLQSIDLPFGLKNIGNNAFEKCGFKNISITNSVTSIGNYAFAGCSGLKNISLPNSVTNIGESAFYNCSSLTNVVLPNSITDIAPNTFSYCTGLNSITIPDSIKAIGNSAFYFCINLSNVYISDLQAWLNLDFDLTNEGYQTSPMFHANNLYLNGELLTKVVIPEGVTSIPSYSLSSNKITSVKFSDSVTTICSNAFRNCKNLINVTISNSVKTIENNAFYYCTSLKNVTIPSSVTEIGDYAFGYYGVYFSTYRYVGSTYKSNDITINGYDNSVAETYSEKNGLPFNNLICTHTEVINKAVAPTCTASGLTEGKNCSTCKDVLVPQTKIKATNHTIKIVGKKAATYFEKGYTGDEVCETCKTTVTKGKAIAKLKLLTPDVKVTVSDTNLSVKYSKVKYATGFKISITQGDITIVHTVKNNKGATKVFKNMKKGECKVKIRAFITQNEKTAYSKWTKVQTVKIK